MLETTDLSQRSISAVLWGASGSATQLILQFSFQIVLARLLGPEQYGLFAIAFVVISFSNFFSSIGIAYGLIQKRTVSDEDVRFVNFWQLSTGSVVAITVFLLAETMAEFFQEPRVTPVIQALSVVCLLQAAAGSSLNLLKRDIDFKSIRLAGVVSYAFGYGLVGIPLAFNGYGVISLVSALITQAVLNLAILYWRKQHVLGFVIWHRDAKALCSYGFTVFATNISNWALMHLSRIVVGRMFPSAAMGLYSISYNLVLQFTEALMGVLQPALFSASSRVQDDVLRLQKAFLAMLGAIALLVAPMFVGIAAVTETIMLALYGHAWRDSAVLLRPFAIAMPLYLIWGMATPMLWTSGRITQEFKLQVPIIFVLAVAAYVSAQYSLEAVAWTMLGIFMLRVVVIVTAACIAIDLRVSHIATAIRAGVAVTVLVAVAIALVDGLAVQMSDKRWVALALDVGTGFFAQVIALRLFRPWFSPEVLSLFEKLLARLPRRFAPFGKSILAVRKRV